MFQVAAHEDIVPIEELYHDCELAREMLTGDYAVGRVIARPFVGEYPNYTRTARRHDYSLQPPRATMLNLSLIHIFSRFQLRILVNARERINA